MTAYIPRFHDFDDMTERRRLPNTIRFLSKLFELVFFVLKPDQQSSIFLHCAISWSCEEVVAQRGPKITQNPSTKGFISAISVSPTRHSHPSTLISRKLKVG